MLLMRLGAQCADDVILHRIVPTLLHAVEDAAAHVRAVAVRALRALLSVVKKVDTIESNIFPQYIFPALNSTVAKDPELIVRVAFAESIGRFAETAKRFLDQAHLAAQTRSVTGETESRDRDASSVATEESAARSAGTRDGTSFVHFGYDKRLKALHEQV